MFKWNIRNQILSTGILGFLVVVIAIYNFYGFSSGQFIGSTKNLISLSGQQYSKMFGQIFQKQSADFESWISDDVYGLAIEFETTGEFSSEFAQRLKQSNGFAILTLVDQSGKILEIAGSQAHSGAARALKGKRLADFPSFNGSGKANVKFLESQVLKGLGSTDPNAYVFYHPAYSSDGKINGAFIAYTDWNKSIEGVQKCADNMAAIGLDNTRVMFIFPKSEDVTIHIGADGSVFPEYRTSELVSWSKSAGDQTVVEADFSDMTMLAGLYSIEQPTVGSFKNSAEGPSLLAAIDLAAVTSNLNDLVLQIIILAGLGTVIALGASYYVARKISSRVALIGSVAEEISRGDINQEIAISSNDEIGQLAESFKRLIDYLKSLAHAAEEIARNDLTIVVEPRSESDVLGNSFKTMVGNLTNIVGLIAQNATQIVTAATEISSSAEEMARGANNQTEQSTQISAAIEEMAATILQSSKNANEAREISEGASAMAAEGQSVVGDTISGMISIADSAADSGMIVNELATASDKIGEIISVIDDIADQTNLLALNAAIEAARAGEQGRGFAVVADEVRKLAERTGKATGEITEMIKGIQNDSERAVESMEQAGKLVEDGKTKADRAGSSLNEINTMSAKVMDMIVQIATASDEQSAAAEQISRNMEEIASVSRQTASGAKESASAAENLNKQADSLQTIVDRFQLVNTQ